MIVADTSALVSLAVGDTLELVLVEFDVHTTEAVLRELRETATYDDVHGTAAKSVFHGQEALTVHETGDATFESSRVDVGEASCVALVRDLDAGFLLTDDLRALPELETLVEADVAISPLVLRALVKRGVLGDTEARTRVERIAEGRDWLGAPIYRRAMRLFDE